MIIEQIILEGFLSYKKRQVINFPSVSICLVNGAIDFDTSLSNGAGKSSLFEAISVNLFGKIGGRGDVLDNYINDSMDVLFIDLFFKIDNIRYRSTFSRNRNSSTKHDFFIDSNNQEFSKALWKKIDKTPDEILGLSFNTYNSTIYLNERDTLKFIDGASNDRKEILRDLLNAEVFEKALQNSNKRNDDLLKQIEINSNLIQNKQELLLDEEQIKKEIDECKTSIKQIEKLVKVEESLLKKLEEDKDSLFIKIEKQKLIEQQVIKLKEKKFEYEEIISSSKNKIVTIKRKEQEIQEKIKTNKDSQEIVAKKKTTLKKNIQALKQESKQENYEKILKELTERITLKNKEVHIKEKEIVKIQTEQKQITSLLEKFDTFGSICPISEEQCSLINETFKNDFKTEKQDKINKLNFEISVLEKNITLFENELEILCDKQKEILDSIEKKNKVLEQLSEYRKQLEIADNNESKYVSLNEELKNQEESLKNQNQELELTIKSATEKLQNIENEILELLKTIEKNLFLQYEENQNKIKDQKEKLKSFENVKNENTKKISICESKIESNKTIKKHIDTLTKTNEELYSLKEIFTILSAIFGKEGIQKSIISDIIPFLEQSSLELLKIFNNDSEKIKIKFDLDPKNSDGSFKKGGGLDILVLEEDKQPKDLKMYSGGERVRLIFSIILGLAKLLSKRSGKKHETLIIDEKIAKLDRKGIEQFVEVIEIISKWYKQIYIITHIEGLKDIFDNEILVNKTNEGSIVSINN